jgi:hypothetical protein
MSVTYRRLVGTCSLFLPATARQDGSGALVIVHQAVAHQRRPRSPDLPTAVEHSSQQHVHCVGRAEHRSAYSGLGFVGVESDIGCAVQDALERSVGFDAGEVHSEADVRPSPERDVGRGRARNIECFGVGVAPLVVVRSGDEDEDVLIGGDVDPGEVGVSCGLPCDHEEGCLPTQALFDRGTDQCSIVLESVELLGVGEETDE